MTSTVVAVVDGAWVVGGGPTRGAVGRRGPSPLPPQATSTRANAAAAHVATALPLTPPPALR
ncbi:MAG: hypothetical protein ACRD0D_11850 [Acidimicrobiales bacterium]